MPSLLSADESSAHGYAGDDHDDCKSIRRDCRSCEDWQSQLLRSLQQGGWTAGMLLYLPAPLPIHWIMLIRHECSFDLINEMALQSSEAYKICGNDRRLWMSLACKSLTDRGWTPTMLSHAWGIPKTNVYRYLELEIVQLSPQSARRPDV